MYLDVVTLSWRTFINFSANSLKTERKEPYGNLVIRCGIKPN